MVQHRPLVVIEIPRLGGPFIQVPRQLQHVVNATAPCPPDVPLQLRPSFRACFRRPAFAVAGSASLRRPRPFHLFVPEVIGDIMNRMTPEIPSPSSAAAWIYLRDVVSARAPRSSSRRDARDPQSAPVAAVAAPGPLAVIRCR